MPCFFGALCTMLLQPLAPFLARTMQIPRTLCLNQTFIIRPKVPLLVTGHQLSAPQSLQAGCLHPCGVHHRTRCSLIGHKNFCGPLTQIQLQKLKFLGPRSLFPFAWIPQCPIPIPCSVHKGTYITEGIHYTPVLGVKSLGDEVTAFADSLRTLSSITGATIVPWDKTNKIKLVRLETRPHFPHQDRVSSLLTDYLTSANGTISFACTLNLPTSPPPLLPHDALLCRNGLIWASMCLRTQLSWNHA